jgi:hypothetical protein
MLLSLFRFYNAQGKPLPGTGAHDLRRRAGRRQRRVESMMLQGGSTFQENSEHVETSSSYVENSEQREKTEERENTDQRESTHDHHHAMEPAQV